MDTMENKLENIYKILSKIPQQVWVVAVLPEFGVCWEEMSNMLRKSHLRITPENLASVLCGHIKATMTVEEVDEIISKLRLKFVATQNKTWHVYKLLQPFSNDPLSEIIHNLQVRIEYALRSKLKNKKSLVETTMLDDLLYISVQVSSGTTKGTVRYFVTSPGEPVLLAGSTGASAALNACVEGLGYRNFENAMLHGCDVHSLLRISSGAWTAEVENFPTVPTYNPEPVITKNSIDYTNQEYNRKYIDNMIGKNPPLLTDLSVNCTKNFHDRELFSKPFNLRVDIKTDNLAETLKSWGANGALEPTSELFKIFHVCKSNRIEYNRDGGDDDGF